ncbi:putative pre-RNA splicing factor Slt11 [Phyllosticta paracitricarpa]|uniref:RRM domain-containing protein n=1 Tax=Phyllosticta paracitricarpa TaxID=2016321 RepID=A0ABR1NBZ7_9PEZI
MPPQIKHDLNRSGWETTDFPSVCERCLPENPYVQMLKEDYGAECKICTRPFTIFRWKADRTARQKRTNVCLTCARLKNCCQCCMLDLSFGLPIVVRDAALKMVAPGPQSDINREYFAQEHEKEIEEGRGAVEAYEKTDEKARDLLRRLAQSEPYYKKQRRLENEAEEAGESSSAGQKALPAPGGGEMQLHKPGPIRTRDTKAGRGVRGAANAAHAPRPEDIQPPADKKITSLFVTGVEDDLPEHEIRTFFSKFGQLRSLICSHRSHCAFVNYASRKTAEAAAEACQGRAIIKGVPLRIQWGKPRPLDTMERDERMAHARSGRQTREGVVARTKGGKAAPEILERLVLPPEDPNSLTIAPPPGTEDANYPSLAGN